MEGCVGVVQLFGHLARSARLVDLRWPTDVPHGASRAPLVTSTLLVDRGSERTLPTDDGGVSTV